MFNGQAETLWDPELPWESTEIQTQSVIHNLRWCSEHFQIKNILLKDLSYLGNVSSVFGIYGNIGESEYPVYQKTQFLTLLGRKEEFGGTGRVRQENPKEAKLASQALNTLSGLQIPI